MGLEMNNIPDFNDIIFASRNKDYGAYQLRKRYNAVVAGGIILAILICSTAVLLPFLLNRPSEHIISGGSRYVTVNMENLQPPQEPLYVPPAPPPPRPKNTQVVNYIPPEIVDSVPPLENKTASVDEILSSQPANLEQEDATGYGDELLNGDVGSGAGDAFFLVEVMPSFKGGGMEKFREYIRNHTNYPKEAVEKKIKGTVYLSFVVERDGSVSTVTIMKGVNPLLDGEAVKVISDSPKWSPGLQRGLPVRVRYLIPVNFNFL